MPGSVRPRRPGGVQGDALTAKEPTLLLALPSPPRFADVEAAAQGQVICRSPSYLFPDFRAINFKAPLHVP